MDYQREVERALIRGLAYRATRRVPVAVAVAILLGIWLFGFIVHH
jgi:hypothetical protein